MERKYKRKGTLVQLWLSKELWESIEKERDKRSAIIGVDISTSALIRAILSKGLEK